MNPKKIKSIEFLVAKPDTENVKGYLHSFSINIECPDPISEEVKSNIQSLIDDHRANIRLLEEILNKKSAR